MTLVEPSPKPDRQHAHANDRRTWGLTPIWLLTFIATSLALSLGSRFFVPVTLGLMLAAVLHPIVGVLRRVHVPYALAAAVAVLAALAVLVAAVIVLGAPARRLRTEIPKTLMMARSRLESLGIPLPGNGTSRTSDRSRNAPGASSASSAPNASSARRDSTTESQRSPSALPPAARTTPTSDTSRSQQQGGAGGSAASGIGQAISGAFGVTAAVLFALVEILLLAFFILAAGDAWYEKIRQVSRTPERGARALDTILEIRHVVLRYLLVNVIINAGQAILVSLIVWPLRYPSPILWGVLTFVAEFVPYFGGVAMVALLFLTGLASGSGLPHAIIAPSAYLLITTLQNNLVSPAAYGRSLRLNPTAILAGVMFWALVWGVAGVFLAVPLLAAMRVVAEKRDALAPVAVFLAD